MALKHAFESAAADSADATKLRPSNWGSTSTDYATTPTHVFSGGALGSLAYRDTGAADGLNWLAAAEGVLACAGAAQVPAFTLTPTLTSLTLGSGSAAAPALATAAFTTTGPFWEAGPIYSIAAGGTKRVGISATAVTSSVPLQVTSTSPSYFTGIGGNLGIGRTTADAPLHITVNAGGAGFYVSGTGGTLRFTQGGVQSSMLVNSSTVPFVIGTDAGATVAGSVVSLQTNGVNALNLAYQSVAALGFIGINTLTPQSLLDVQGPIGTGAAGAGILTLATKELTIVDGDQLGRINFNAPLESAGGDAILAGAAIWAEADATFSATVNSTDLVFGTATTSAAIERMRLDSAGNLSLASGYLQGFEMTAPSAPAANGGRIYLEDNGAGKTRLMVIFQSGAAQQIAIEP